MNAADGLRVVRPDSMLKRLPRRSTWRSSRAFGLRRTRVDAFRVYAMLVVILAHSDTALGGTENRAVQVVQLVMNVVGRAAVPLFLILAGEHIGPRLLRNRVPGAVWPYVRRLATMVVVAQRVLLAVRPGQAGTVAWSRRRHRGVLRHPGRRPAHRAPLRGAAAPLVPGGADHRGDRRGPDPGADARAHVRARAPRASTASGWPSAPTAASSALAPGHWWYEWVLQSPLFFGLGVVIGAGPTARRGSARRLGLIAAGIVIHALEVHWITTTHGTSPFRLAMLHGHRALRRRRRSAGASRRGRRRSSAGSARFGALRAPGLPQSHVLPRGAAAAARHAPRCRWCGCCCCRSRRPSCRSPARGCWRGTGCGRARRRPRGGGSVDGEARA